VVAHRAGRSEEAGVTTWQEELQGKFVWNPQLGFAGVVAKAHGPGEYRPKANDQQRMVDSEPTPVPAPVIEFEDGTSMVASDDRRANFQPMTKSAAMLHELATKVVQDSTLLLAEHAKAYGLGPKVSALVIGQVLARQARALRKVQDVKEVADGPEEPAAPVV
jgi:hypothetical protein